MTNTSWSGSSFVVGPGVEYEQPADMMQNAYTFRSVNDAWAAYDMGWTLQPSSTSGVRVDEEKALTLGLVFQAVSMISADVARLPLHVYRVRPDGSKDIERSSVVDGLLSRVANDIDHSRQFWRQMMIYALLYGNAFAYISRDGRGEPAALIPLLPDRTWREWIDGFGWVYSTEIAYRERAEIEALYPSQVLHIRGVQLDLYRDYRQEQFIKYAREAFGLALAQRGFKSKYFARGGRVGGILQLPEGISKTASDRIEEGFKRSYESVEAAFQTVILREGVRFEKSQMSPDESQMTQTEADIGREVARWFNLAPSRLGVPESQSYGSKQEDNRAYYDQTLAPWTETAIQPECEMKLLPRDAVSRGDLYVKHDTRQLLSMNMAERFSIYDLARKNGIMSPNECRLLEDMPRRSDPAGDEFANPNTTTGDGNIMDHRELFTRTLTGTLKVAGQRAAKAAKSPQAIKTHAAGKLLVNLRKPAQEAAQVARLHSATDWEPWIYAELVSMVAPALEAVAGEPSAHVASVFDDAMTRGVAEIAARIYGGCNAECV